MWLGVEGADVIVNRNGGPMFGEDALAVRLTFYELNRLNSAEPAGSE